MQNPSSLVLAAFVAFSYEAHAKAKHYPLPSGAKIQVGASYSDEPNQQCGYFRLSARAIRARFRTIILWSGASSTTATESSLAG